MKTNMNLAKIISIGISLALCFAVAVFALTGQHWSLVLPAFAHTNAGTGNVTSSPSSGPVGTTVTVVGSNIPPPITNQTEVVIFGYSAGQSCAGFTSVGIGSNPSISNGNFTGTFNWPSSANNPGQTYAVCVQISNVSGSSSTLTLTSSSSFKVSVSQPSLTSSPTSGAPGRTITVSGFVPPASSGTQTVTFGYSTDATCDLFYKAGNGSNPTVSNGSFIGTFTWPTSGTTVGKTYIVCAQITNVSGGAILTLFGNNFLVTPLLISTPTSGAPGTTITVSGSYLPRAIGATETVTFGYSPNATCNLFYPAGNGSSTRVINGSFQGTFTWPTSGTTVGTQYYVCAQITNVSGGGTLTLTSINTFKVT